jgi:hypothetical protein
MTKKDPIPGYEFRARLVIYDAAKMTDRGRKQIANWLKAQANALLAEGEDYSPRYTAKWWCKK